MLTVPALEIWNFNIFSKFTKFHQTCRIYWNHHQKHACEIWAFSEKLTYFIEKCRQCRPFIISWNFNIFSKFTKFHQTCRTYFESSSETCMWNLSQFRKVDLFHRKMPTVPALWNIMKFQHFFKVHQISSNLQNILESSSETFMWNLSPFREVNLSDRKMLTVPALWNIMKFQYFFKVHQISSNLQNSFESSSETCMWNLSPFREVIFFHKKMLTVQALEISWNFNIFSKFTKFHQTCRTYLNHHQKHACEIWAHSEKLTYLIEKCWQCRPFEISWNFNIFSKFTKFHQTCRTYLNHHQKHACEIWENSEKLTYFIEKYWQCGPLKYHEISTFFQSSPNFIKLAEHIGIIIRNMHVKFEPIQKSWLISQKNTDSAGPLKYHEISTFFQSSPNFIKLAEHFWIIIRNMHVKFEPIQKSWLISQKNDDSAGPLKYHEISTFFQISSNLQNIFESSSETCMWNLRKFREVDLFHRKMLTVQPFEISWNFNIFSKFTKFHQTCRTYWNHHQKHACEIWANSEKLTYFTEKCRQCRPFEISWNFNIFSKFTKFHQTCRTYLNHHQKHACEIEPIQRSWLIS